jgi:hypothetical protein
MSYKKQLLEQLRRAEERVNALPRGIRESHPVWQEVQERRLRSEPQPQEPPSERPRESQKV